MSLYSFSSEPTSASPAPSKVPLGDLPLQAGACCDSTPPAHVITNSGDVERQRIKANGLACLGRLHGDMTWEDWMGAGAAMVIITGEALVEVGALKWDPNNKRLAKAFNVRWEEYEAGAGNNHKPLSKQERCALREIMGNPDISAWRSTLTGPEKRKLNYPKAVLARFKAQAKAKTTTAEDRAPSPQAKLKAANIELQEELHRLKQRGDGNAFTRTDSPKAIVTVIVGTFDGLANKTAKVEAIARELNSWMKQQKMAAQ
jgi:hypothetical protein